MSAPVVAFFNNKGGVGKTTLVYHLAWMYADQGLRVLAADLDPQANLSGALLDDDVLESLWSDSRTDTIHGGLLPLLEGTGNPEPPLELPRGLLRAAGYVVLQHSVRLDRPVRAYDHWMARIPQEYAESLHDVSAGPDSTGTDPHCLMSLCPYSSLIQMAQESRKPVFHLNAADGAIGSHAGAVLQARKDFDHLARRIASVVLP